MDKNILQQLFEGSLRPFEEIKPNSPEHNAAKDSLGEEKEHFFKTLSGDEAERFRRLNDLYLETLEMYSYESFEYGFRLGVVLLLETLNGKDRFERSS